jgi:predicted nucleotidyltransferase
VRALALTPYVIPVTCSSNMTAIARLAPNESAAVARLKQILARDFGLVKLVLYGSKARGDSHWQSDIDVLLVLRDEFDWRTKHAIYDVCFDINLEYDVLIQPIIYSQARYDDPLIRATPLYQSMLEEGVAV